MNSHELHTHQQDDAEGIRPCLRCHKRSRKPRVKKMTAGSGIRDNHGESKTVVKGTRALSDADRQLQERITEQTLYRDKLEKALAELQKSISSEPHPLLKNIKTSKVRVPALLHETVSGSKGLTSDIPPGTDADELVETFGMLSIRNDGKRQFHGETATSEYLFEESIESPVESCLNENRAKHALGPLQLPPELVLANVQFPCPPMDQPPMDMNVFLPCLPHHDRAVVLVQNYLSSFCWCSMPVPKDDIEQTLNNFYPNRVKTSTLCISDAHKLSVLFMVFLLGTLYDIDLDVTEFSAQTEEFHSLARAAMTADPVTEHTTVQGIQAIVLMIWYFRMFPGRRSLNYQWALSGFLNKLVQAIGLHRDSSKRIPDAKERGRYEQTFWEFNCVDIWQSYMFGRPTSMISSMVDCKLPETVFVTPGLDPSFYLWKYSYSRLVSDVVGHISGTTTQIVVGQTCAEPVAYSDIVRYDKLLREHDIPSSFAWPDRDEPLPTNEKAGKMFQRFVGHVWRQETAIMYLHRQYFWVAILQHAYNPSQSPYGRSVSVVYHSAVSIVHGMRRLWHAHPRLIERMCPFWSHCMSAALVLGALVAKSPGYQLAETALLHFDDTYEMFEEADDSLQPRNARSAMLKLQRKAHEAFSRFHDTADQLAQEAEVSPRPDITESTSTSDTQSPFEVEFYAPHASHAAEDQLTHSVSASLQANPTPLPGHPQDAISVPYGLFGGMPVEYDMAHVHIGMQNY